MKRFYQKHSVLSLLLLILLIAAMAGSVVSCGEKDHDDGATSAPLVNFTFEVVFRDGSTQTHSIETAKKTVGDALLEKGLIAGEEGQYGLYVKTVCGQTLDYDTDGMYWSFYVGNDYAMTGVDSTDIVAGTTYRMVASK